jgi:predicted DCC family thiol-disulfide oxidoreductase YuxK
MTRAVLIYDGLCPLCRRAVTWISRRVIRGQLEFLPCQAAERRARFPEMEERVCLGAMQLVLPDGRVVAGAAAAPEILRRLWRWRWLAAAFRLPGMGLVAPRAYAWIARHRYQISSLIGQRHDHRSS